MIDWSGAVYRLTSLHTRSATEIAELRMLVLRLLPTITWRHHAIGALQGYVSEDTEPELRVHIWHPNLVRCDTATDGGRIHDHRFDLRSTVLAGSVGHEEVHVTPDENGDLVEYTVQHARKGAAPLRRTGRTLKSVRCMDVIESGVTYKFPAGAFHRSFVPEPAVTLVTKLGQKATSARVLFPRGFDPSFGVNAIEPDKAAWYVDLARTALSRTEGSLIGIESTYDKSRVAALPTAVWLGGPDDIERVTYVRPDEIESVESYDPRNDPQIRHALPMSWPAPPPCTRIWLRRRDREHDRESIVVGCSVAETQRRLGLPALEPEASPRPEG